MDVELETHSNFIRLWYNYKDYLHLKVSMLLFIHSLGTSLCLYLHKKGLIFITTSTAGRKHGWTSIHCQKAPNKRENRIWHNPKVSIQINQPLWHFHVWSLQHNNVGKSQHHQWIQEDRKGQEDLNQLQDHQKIAASPIQSIIESIYKKRK